MQIGSEDDRVGLRELCVGAGVERGQVARVAALDPQCRGVVGRVVRALSDAHADARHVLPPWQVCQVRLQQKNNFIFITLTVITS